MNYQITSEFTKLNESSGTIQNISYVHTLEISNSNSKNSGFLLFPLNKVSFNGAVYVRCTDEGGRADIRVVNFIADSSGGASSATNTPTPMTEEELNDIFSNNDSPEVFSQSDLDDLFSDSDSDSNAAFTSDELNDIFNN